MVQIAVTAQTKRLRDVPIFKLQTNKRQLIYNLIVLEINIQEK